MGEPAIEVRGLSKSFDKKQAVAGIDLDIAAGSLAGLVGPNGAGKTTSLSMMTGLLRPDAGQIVINGLDVWADPSAAKAVIGVVPAEARLFEAVASKTGIGLRPSELDVLMNLGFCLVRMRSWFAQR